jgi:uncharacterized membrane protein
MADRHPDQPARLRHQSGAVAAVGGPAVVLPLIGSPPLLFGLVVIMPVSRPYLVDAYRDLVE